MSATATSLRLPAVRLSILLPFAAVLAALLAGLILVAALGVPVKDAVAAFLDGAFGSAYAITESVNRALVFALIGSGFVLADRTNLTNVGGEGQIAMGGMAATAICPSARVRAPPSPAWRNGRRRCSATSPISARRCSTRPGSSTSRSWC